MVFYDTELWRRELTNHAVELFALKALQGEVVLDENPYTIPQAGYCHDWDCHGGSAWLHQHVMNNYVYCWQQALSNGEIDGAVCDIGTSRWFNYYLEGLRRSVESPPHMDGIYYDVSATLPPLLRHVAPLRAVTPA